MWEDLESEIAEEFSAHAGGDRYEVALERWGAYTAAQRAEYQRESRHERVPRRLRTPNAHELAVRQVLRGETEQEKLVQRAAQLAARERRLISDQAVVAAARHKRVADRIERRAMHPPGQRGRPRSPYRNKYDRDRAAIAEIRAARRALATPLPAPGRSPELEAKAQRISAALAAKRAAGWVNAGRGGIGRRRKEAGL